MVDIKVTNSISPKKKAGILFAVLFLLLIPSILVVQNSSNDIRNLAAGSSEVNMSIVTPRNTYSPGDSFTTSITMNSLSTRTITTTGGQAVITIPTSVFSINSVTCTAPFDGFHSTNVAGDQVTFFCAILTGVIPPTITSNSMTLATINLTVLPNAPLGTSTLSFVGTKVVEAGVPGESPDVSNTGTNLSIQVAAPSVTPPAPSLTPSIIPSITPSIVPSTTVVPPSVTPPVGSPTPTRIPSVVPSATGILLSPTPPFNTDSYLISIGTKNSLTINIGPGDFLRVNFRAKLADTENHPDLILRMRVKDELAFTQNPPSSADTCQAPGTGSRDFYIPVQADANGVYSPTATAVVTPASGITPAFVESDGWVRLPGLIADRFYTFSLKGPKTRGTKMVEHTKLAANKPAAQNFDWSTNLLMPGDLPDPNNNSMQDCTVNSIDLSLMVDRQAQTNQSAVDIADVNYDGVVNGNDISKVVNTLSTKPDDD